MDDDDDGTPDTTDPEPQNPTVPMANSEPPAEDTPSQGEQAVEHVREDYDDFLERPENATYRDRLNRIKEKYRQAAELEDEAAVDINAGFEQVRLIAEANQELGQLENELGEAWWASLSKHERQLFNNREQAVIDEMQMHMKKWDKATYDDVAESILDHSSRKGYDPLDYLRDASNFSTSGADREPLAPGEYYSDGTATWRKRTGEFITVDRNGMIRTYGVNLP